MPNLRRGLHSIERVSVTWLAMLCAVSGVLIGLLIGTGIVHRTHVRGAVGPVDEDLTLSEDVTAVLGALQSSALLVDSSDTVLKASAPAQALGLLRNNRIAAPELARLVAEVRRDGIAHEADLVIPQTAGLPPRTVRARVARVNPRLILALADDRTRERRLESIRRDFVVNVSHELKTPVGAIKLLADAVRDAADDPEAIDRFAARMTVEGDRLARLVQQIIELSRLQDDDPLDSPNIVDIDTVVVNIIDANATDAVGRGIDVRRTGTHGLNVLGNHDQIELAVSNLVANAIKYSIEGSTIVVTVKVVDSMIEVGVTDQGVGIPPDELDRIFERFYRVDPARHRSTGGSGLGLSIVKHVAASHGGDVRVWSAEGQGSTFTLTLPHAFPEQGTDIRSQEKPA